MKLKKGDIVEFNKGLFAYTANTGAKAIYQGRTYTDRDGGELIEVKWIRDELSGEQNDGEYYSSMFTKVEEVSHQKEVRILSEISKEKNMESIDFNFNEGVGRVIEYLTNFIEVEETLLLNNLNQFDDLDDLRYALDSLDTLQTTTERSINILKISKTISEVIDAVEDTTLRDEDVYIISLLLGIEIEEI
jgi:hypothetical protein